MVYSANKLSPKGEGIMFAKIRINKSQDNKCRGLVQKFRLPLTLTHNCLIDSAIRNANEKSWV
jgi:hypothetical protein